MLNKIKNLFIKREKNSEDISDFTSKRMGISMAATWSWGAALAVGIAIMQSKGFYPFLIWSIGNVLSIPLFGFLYTKVKGVSKWKNFIPFIFLWGFIGIFAIIMNLNALKAGLGGGTDIVSYQFMPEPYLTYFIFAVGFGIVWFIHKKGLRGSVLTDVGQFALQFIGVIGIIIAGITTGARAELSWILPSAEGWILPAFLGIITGATASGMQWQRIEGASNDKKLKSTLWGGLYFGLFILLVAIAGLLFDGSLAVSIPFFICVLAITTSTTDSGVSSLHYVSKKLFNNPNIGTIIALMSVAFFGLVSSWGLTRIWGFYAGVRWKIVISLLLFTLITNVIKSRKKI